MLVGAFMTDKTGYSKRKDVDSISACIYKISKKKNKKQAASSKIDTA